MPRGTTTVTTTQEVQIAPKVQKQLRTHLDSYASLQGEIKALDEAKKGTSAAVLDLALKHVDGDKFKLDGYGVAVVKGAKNKRLNTDRLIKRLVKDGKYSVTAAKAVLEDCTDETPKKDHVRITVPGEKGDDE